MENVDKDIQEIEKIKELIKDGRIDDAVKKIASYLGKSTEENYINRLENLLETLSSIHGGRTVLRFLIENLVIDIPSLLENLSKQDSVLRYTFLLLLKSLCENECDLFLPFSEELLNSEDPNVREAALQLLVYMAGGETEIDDEKLIKSIALRLNDEMDFVVEKAIQALKLIGKKSPLIITRILKDLVKEVTGAPENESVKNSIDLILKSIVTVDKIEEIVEEEKTKKEDILQEKESSLKEEESQILDKEFELEKKKLEIKRRKLELEEKKKDIEEKVIQKKDEILELKKEIILKEKVTEEKPEAEEKSIKVKLPKKLKKEESKIIDKELELKKRELELKKKKLELEEKEKELDQLEIDEKEKALKFKEELIEKEKELSQVELELKQKSIEQKEEKLKKEEKKRIEEEMKKIETDKNSIQDD